MSSSGGFDKQCSIACTRDQTDVVRVCRFGLGAKRSGKASSVQANLRLQALLVRGRLKLAFGSGWMGASVNQLVFLAHVCTVA